MAELNTANGMVDDDAASTPNAYQLMTRLGTIMERALAVRCDAASIAIARRSLDEEIKPAAQALRAHDSTAAFNQEITAIWEVRHLVALADAVLRASDARHESRGSMRRLDFPERDDEHFLAHSMTMLQGDVTFQPVVIIDYPPQKRAY